MSKYTTEVRFICETYAGRKVEGEYGDVDKVLEDSQGKIFGQYPIFDEAYREILNKKILKHYYTREIGFETVGLWKLKLNAKMEEIMPYYNKMYKSELLAFNPLVDVDVTTEHKGKGESEASGSVDTKNESSSEFLNKEKGNGTNVSESINKQTSDGKDVNKHLDKYSDTPQGGIENLDNGFLTNARDIGENNTSHSDINGSGRASGRSEEEREGSGKSGSTDVGNQKSQSKAKNIDEYLDRVHGKTSGQSYSHMLKEYRDTFLRLDELIIGELKDLFFGLFE